MGCVVNGPGEARDADLGIAAGRHRGHLFVKGKIVRVVPEDEMVDALVEEAEKLVEEGVEARAGARPTPAPQPRPRPIGPALLDEQGTDANQRSRVELIELIGRRRMREAPAASRRRPKTLVPAPQAGLTSTVVEVEVRPLQPGEELAFGHPSECRSWTRRPMTPKVTRNRRRTAVAPPGDRPRPGWPWTAGADGRERQYLQPGPDPSRRSQVSRHRSAPRRVSGVGVHPPHRAAVCCAG